jgi:uncharacterized membrane protein YgcG
MSSSAMSLTPTTVLTTSVPSILNVPISEKLTNSNYPLWSAQVLPSLQAVQLQDLLTGVEKAPAQEITTTVDDKPVKQPNPAYIAWVARDQAILGYLLSTLTRETLMHVSQCAMAIEAWKTLSDLYSSQSRARSVNMRIALATTKKNHLTVSDYYVKMSQFAEELAASGTPLRDDEFVAYLLADLDGEYNPVFTVVVARVDPIYPADLYAQLLSFEQHVMLQAATTSRGSSSAMDATRGCGSFGGRGYGSTDRGRGRSLGRSSHGGGNNRAGRGSSKPSRSQCQVCLKIGHTADNYWHQFEEDYVPEPRTAAATSSGPDYHWYMDSGATDHITGDLDKLTMHDHYAGHDQIHAANRTGMDIPRISKTIIPTPHRDLVLNHVLHVPST